MEFNLEKLISEGKSLLGYDQTEVQDEIISFQKSYLEKKKRLIQDLEITNAENERLKEKLNTIHQPSNDNFLLEELSSRLISVFLEDVQSLEKLKRDLEKLEQSYYETMQLRRKQKELAKRGIHEVTEFLKSLQEDFSIIQESDGQFNER